MFAGPAPVPRAATVQRFGSVRLFDAPPIPPRRLFAITNEPPTERCIGDAVVTRLALDRPQWQGRLGDPVRQTGAVYDAADALVSTDAKAGLDAARLLVVAADPPTLEAGRREAAERLAGRHVYAGALRSHFGHFLLESLCRGWAFAGRPPGAKLVFHGAGTALAPFQATILAALGVEPADVVVATRDLRVEELAVPSSQYDIGVRADRRFAALFDRLRDRLAPPSTENGPRRLYLTRRLVDARARQQLDRLNRPAPARERALRKMLADEEAAEAAFLARGFAVVAPETLPVAEQVRLAAGAEMLAGATGTALHHALFCARPDARILSVATRFSPNQVAIEQVKDLPSVHLFCARPRRQGHGVELALPRLAALLDELGV